MKMNINSQNSRNKNTFKKLFFFLFILILELYYKNY